VHLFEMKRFPVWLCDSAVSCFQLGMSVEKQRENPDERKRSILESSQVVPASTSHCCPPFRSTQRMLQNGSNQGVPVSSVFLEKFPFGNGCCVWQSVMSEVGEFHFWKHGFC
jgi:hypothetical protein